MLNETISINVTYTNGKKRNFDWYDFVAPSMDECYTTEQELTEYIMEEINNPENWEFENATLIKAKSLIIEGGKEVKRLEVEIDRR